MWSLKNSLALRRVMRICLPFGCFAVYLWKTLMFTDFSRIFFVSAFVSVKSAVTWAPSVGECGEEMLTKCRYPLKVLAENKELGFATNKEDLDLICP